MVETAASNIVAVPDKGIIQIRKNDVAGILGYLVLLCTQKDGLILKS